jgi:membrane protein implicated in regulation of membrane protease activity
MPALRLLAFIGVGKTPLLVVLLILFATIGLTGWGLNGLIQSLLFGHYPAIVLFAVLPASVIAGGLVSSRITRFLGKALPPVSTTATRAQALVGRRGIVTSPFVDEKYGLVHVRDAGGTLISLFVVDPNGQGIRRGDTVILASYNPSFKNYTVEKAQNVMHET